MAKYSLKAISFGSRSDFFRLIRVQMSTSVVAIPGSYIDGIPIWLGDFVRSTRLACEENVIDVTCLLGLHQVWQPVTHSADCTPYSLFLDCILGLYSR